MTLVANKKAGLRFSFLEMYTAGIELSGAEVKSLRAKHGSLLGAHIVVRGGEAFLVGMSIPPYQNTALAKGYEPERARRLLLSKKEIAVLAAAEGEKGLTIVPLEVYNNKRYIKVRLAIAQGKGKADKREDIKKREAARESARVLKRRV